MSSRALLITALSASTALFVACGEPSSAPPDDTLNNNMNMPPAATDVRKVTLKGSYTLAPGEERYQCFLAGWSSDIGDLAIQRIVPKQDQFVHHIGVFTDELGAEHQDTWECARMGAWGFVFGGGVGTGPVDMPAGTARKVSEGTKLVFQLHLLNATSKTVETTATVDLELAKPGTNFQPIGTYLIGNTRLVLPAKQKTDVDGTCTTHPELANVFSIFPHMHKLGTALTVSTGTTEEKKLVNVQGWNFGDQGNLAVAPSVRIGKDEPIKTRCSFDNTTDKQVTFGESTNEEMCIAVLYYYPEQGGSSLRLCTR
jgi:hypothetical protein